MSNSGGEKMSWQFNRPYFVGILVAVGVVCATVFYQYIQSQKPALPILPVLDAPQFLREELASSGYQLLPLVSNREIERELVLSPAQQVEFRNLAVALLDDVEVTTRASRVPQGGAVDQQKFVAILHQDFQTRQQRLDMQVLDFLTPSQMQRLGQITLQLRGPDVFSEPRLRAQLALSHEQQKQLANVRAEYVSRVRDLRDKLTAKETTKKDFIRGAESLKKEALDKNVSLLHPLQAERFQMLRGKKTSFESSELSLELRREKPSHELSKTNRD
jgi:hypothetical protein